MGYNDYPHKHGSGGSGGADLVPKTVNSVRHIRPGEDAQSIIEGADSGIYFVVHPDTYTVDGLSLSNGTTLDLLEGATFRLSDGSSSNRVIGGGGGDNLTIKGGGTIDPNPANNTSPNNGISINPGAARTGITIRGITINDPINIGISLFDYSEVRIEGVRIGDGSQNINNFIDVTAQNVDYDTVIIRNNVCGPGHATGMNDGIVVESDVTPDGVGERGVISGNIIKAPWSTSQSQSGNFWGIFVHNNFRSLTIQGNVLRAEDDDGSGAGIAVNSPNGVCTDFTMTGNSLRGSGQSNDARGMHVNGGNNEVHASVTGNTVRNFDTSNEANLVTANIPAANGVVVVGNNADGSTTFDADTAVTANNN